MRYDDGLKLFVGALSPEPVDTTMSQSTFDMALNTFHDRVKKNVMDDLRSFREKRLAVGDSGASLGAQLDLTTAAGEEYITFTVSYVRKGSSVVTRVALATRAFPGTHTAEDIRPWIEAVRRFCCFAVYLELYCFIVLNSKLYGCCSGLFRWLTIFLFDCLFV